MKELLESIEFIESYKEGLIESFEESDKILSALAETLLKDYSDYLTEEEISEISTESWHSDTNRLLEIARSASSRGKTCKHPKKDKKDDLGQKRTDSVLESRHIYPRGSGFQYLCNLAREKAVRQKMTPERIAAIKGLVSEATSTKTFKPQDFKKLALHNKMNALKRRIDALSNSKTIVPSARRKVKEETTKKEDKKR